MSSAPIYDIDPTDFYKDPYPDLQKMRALHPLVFVPQLNATLITKRDDIFENEKKIDIFSSVQPGGLMNQLMGENMMRKDGNAHQVERKQSFPALSPKTVKTIWRSLFESDTQACLNQIKPQGTADMVADIAMRISGDALRHVTGLTNMSWQDLDRVSQGMIDGCANYQADPLIESRCHHATATIDAAIDEMIPILQTRPDASMLSVLLRSGQPLAGIRANIKLAISGGQNEPRDAIAGLVWAMLKNPDQLKLVQSGKITWLQAFEEFARWMSPIGMSPRQIARPHVLHDVNLDVGERIFFMFGSGNRDETVFKSPDLFDITRDTTKSISFGAGPHFCAGAWVSRCLIAEVALPMIFAALPGLRATSEPDFQGWAFRGPKKVRVAWDH